MSVVSRHRTDRDAFTMPSAEPVSESKEWCKVEWSDCTRSIVHSSEVCGLQDQVAGCTVFVNKGGRQISVSLVARSFDRQELENLSNSENEEPALGEDYGDPSDFEPSATDWVPSDENLSDSEMEVENKKRKLNIPKASCKKRQYKPKNVLTPSNKMNTSNTSEVRRRKSRKQAAPKQFISPTKEQPIIFVPSPKKEISPTGKVIHILPNSTRPPNERKKGAPKNKNRGSTYRRNNKNQLPSKGKKAVANGRINKQRKRVYQAGNTNACNTSTPKQIATNMNVQKHTPTVAPTPTAEELKLGKINSNDTKTTAQNNVFRDKPVNNRVKMLKQVAEPKIDKNVAPKAAVPNVINTQNKENVSSPPNIDNRKNDQVKKQPAMINVTMDVNLYSKFRKSFGNMYKVYNRAIKVIPKTKQEKFGVKKLQQKFYKARRVVSRERPRKQKVTVNSVNVVENYSDDNVENETLDDFDRSDDNILISNKFQNINTAKEPKTKNDKEEKWVAIGSGKTLIPKDKFRKIKWNSYTVATRGLLLAAFPRRVLATHSMTGKRSPAFLNKPAKMCLDPKKVADIIIEVMYRYKIKENLVRSVITTKCADESKMFKMRMQKQEKEATATQKNDKKKPTVEA